RSEVFCRIFTAVSYAAISVTVAAADGGNGIENPVSLLASVDLSDKYVASFKPKNVKTTNEKLRQFVQGKANLKAVCKTTSKPTVCENTLKNTFAELNAAYASLLKNYKSLPAGTTEIQRAMWRYDVDQFKDLLAKLKNQAVIKITEAPKTTTKAPVTTKKTTTAITTTVTLSLSPKYGNFFKVGTDPSHPKNWGQKED
ncbi:hypothetical protein PENTCL1PPCAC_487, partial [Pristionchus entomophagus]